MIIPESSPAFAMWKLVADLTNPTLAIVFIAGIILLWRKEAVQARGIFFATIASVVIVYALKILTEDRADLWALAGLNYSTHGAMTIALCVGLSFMWARYFWLFLLAFLAYCALMVILQFHTPADVFATGMVVFPLCFFCQYFAWKRRQQQPWEVRL